MGNDELLAFAKQMILETANPKRIVLFGSWARGEAKKDSDIDLLVVLPDGSATKEAIKAIRHSLISPYASFDILVLTESEFVARRTEGWRLFEEIDRDGKIVYAA
jgi:predicted nucleotidyltransferase